MHLVGLTAVLATGPLTAQANLTGAGATFPNPIYTKWFDAYAKKTEVKVNYQSIGSGGGIRQFTQGTVDFGASDAPMTDEQIAPSSSSTVPPSSTSFLARSPSGTMLGSRP
jgi:phosphate transport system substrate-binding protein